MIEPNIERNGGASVSFAQVNGVSLYYEFITSTRDSEETIVFFHGNGFDSSRWGHLIDGLKEDYHLLLVDLRGCGKSEPTLGEISWDLFVHDIYTLIGHLNLQTFHLIGHSFGGSLAIFFAIRYPKLVKCLVLISINVLFPETSGSTVIKNYMDLIEKYGMGYMLQHFLLPSLTVYPFRHEEAQRLYNMYADVPVESYMKLFKLHIEQRPVSELSWIQSPTLLLAGECDTVYPSSFQNMTAELIPDATFYIVPNAANAIFIDQPDVTVEWIKDFIQRKRNRPVETEGVEPSEMASSIQHMWDSYLQTLIPSRQNPVPVVKVELLFGFRVSVNGQEILDGWNKRYAQNIFVYLVLHPSSTREDLCDAIFPSLPLPIALKNLKVYLNYLKKLLTYDQDQNSILKTDRKHLYLQCKIECDLLDFFEHIKQTLHHEDNEAEMYESCKRLFRFMRNKEIMPGIFDQWFIEKKARAEFRLGVLAAWMSGQEKKRGNVMKAAEFKKLANYYTSEEE
ncbi:alpha/beta fold hydrolase [Paenibacillus sp. WC2504]|uniref:alpha/beta fold hydrolase n=1 Tax=Paenibacillus sp. WC2504 TaxID=3461403 RepID=UPI004045FB87